MNVEAPRMRVLQPDVADGMRVDMLKLPSMEDCAAVSRFTGRSGLGEWHVTVATESEAGDPVQALERVWLDALQAVGLSVASTVMRRVHGGDVSGHADALERFARAYPGAFGFIGQAPVPGRPLAIYSYHLTDPGGPLDRCGGDNWHGIQRGPLRHCWNLGWSAPDEAGAGAQCERLLDRYTRWLARHDMTLADHVVRTWWHLRDIDHEYGDMVGVRRDWFRRHELTERTHYIASTGIAGSPMHPAARLSFDAYAIKGLTAGQVEFLEAPDHLGPTHAYGVTFERATKLNFADRSHVWLSGTASIDVAGEIVHPGDVMRQLDRALENVDALLAAGGAGSEDLAMMLVYLRDPADGACIHRVCRQRFPGLPLLVLHAPVCRPGWLVEVEGLAVVPACREDLPAL